MTESTMNLKTGVSPVRKRMKKLGTVDIGVVETTPVVWKDRLLRFEWVRNSGWGFYHRRPRDKGCYHFVDMTTGEETPDFAEGYSFGCCYENGGEMFVVGVEGPGGGRRLDAFVSRDLVNWEKRPVLEFPEDIRLYNTSVCFDGEKYLMAIEIGGKNPAVGVGFTAVFARSDDLVEWELLDMKEYSFNPKRYTGCPTVRSYGGYYYLICLEALPLERYAPYIYRSRDLVNWEPGVVNPIMFFDDQDKLIAPGISFSEEELKLIGDSVNCNDSDVDLCEYRGKTVILYSWGNQHGKEFLAKAEYDGGEREFLESFF